MRCKVSLEYAVIRHLSNPRFSRICAILLAGLWNEILDGEHVHPIRCLRVFLAFAPSKWKDKFAFFGSQFFSCLIEMCVWWFYYDLIEKHHAPGVDNDTMVPPGFSHSLLVYHPPPNLSVCASTRLQTSVFPPGWLQGRRRCRPIINYSVFPLNTNRLI